MPRRPWPTLLPTAALLVVAGLVACDDAEDADEAVSTTGLDAVPVAPATAASVATTVAPTTSVAVGTTTPPSPTTPASVIADTEAVGGSTLSAVDLATGATTLLGGVGDEVGVLGVAVAAAGAIDAVTDVPTLVVLDPAAPDAVVAPTPVDAGGATLLALARRPSDGALFAIADSGAVVRLGTDGRTTAVAEVALDDPGVGLDIAADGSLEVVVATGARWLVDVDTGEASEQPALTGDEAQPRVVAIAHDAGGRRYGLDAATDELVAITDDGRVETIGPLGFDVTDGASLDIGPDGVAVLANPG